MKTIIATLAIVASTSAAFADYSHRWITEDRVQGQMMQGYAGVEINNYSNRKMSCKVTVRVQQCFGWSCNIVERGGAIGIIYPGNRRTTTLYKGAPYSYQTSCRFVN